LRFRLSEIVARSMSARRLWGGSISELI
jgi:hypothetical protein